MVSPTSKRTAVPSRRGHRRRLFERLSRISSSPQLSNFPKPIEVVAYPNKHTVSCVSLYTATGSGASTPTRALETVEIPYGTEGESLRISIPPRRKTRRDIWSGLPDEVKVGVLSWLAPRELVRCSAVSIRFCALEFKC